VVILHNCGIGMGRVQLLWVGSIFGLRRIVLAMEFLS